MHILTPFVFIKTNMSLSYQNLDISVIFYLCTCNCIIFYLNTLVCVHDINLSCPFLSVEFLNVIAPSIFTRTVSSITANIILVILT